MDLWLYSPINFQGEHSVDFTLFFTFFGTTMQTLAEILELKGMCTLHGVLL